MTTELETLLAAAEAGDLTPAQRTRLNELLREDDAALDTAVDQLEVDALLRWQHGTAVSPATADAHPTARFGFRHYVAAAIAAGLLLMAGLYVSDLLRKVELGPDWQVDPTGDAEFTVLASHEIRLDRGELRVRSTKNTTIAPLTIRTPSADATAKGTSFLIGAHKTPTTNERPERKERDMKNLTRVLVLTGTVTLSSSLGAAEGTANDLLYAPQDQSPSKLVLRTGGDFGFDLYRQLVKKNPGEDVFFSPFSIASALTMAAEGARGDTAEEMARVLRWPEATRRVGDDDQSIPFEAARIHGAFSELNRLFNTASDQNPEQKKILARLDVLKKQLTTLQAEYDALRKKRDRGYREVRRKMAAPQKEYETLARQVKSYRLRVANALWGDKSYPFAKDYLQTIRRAYDSGAVVPADFRNDPKAEIDRINAWVEKQTEGRIKDIASYPAINDLTRLVLLNAIYFKAEWEVPFEALSSRDRPFTALDGSKNKRKMMQAWNREDCRYGAFVGDGSFFASPVMIDRGQKDGIYPGRGGFQVLEIPYRGGDLSMVVLLPQDPDGISDLEKQLSSTNLHQWLARLESRKVNIRLPKWKSETSYPLNEALQAMGMKRAFSQARAPAGADFSGMVAEGSKAEELHIQAVIHKAFVEVNEAGTEAAAATMVAVGAKSDSPQRVRFVPNFDASRSFVYLIRDRRSGVVLFTGRVVK